jgi:hypothetical protein
VIEGSTVSIHSSIPLLESVPPTPSSSPPSPPPLQLHYIPHGDAGPTYALQVGPSLHLQPVQQRLALLHQLRNVLILEGEEENILSRRSSPAAAATSPATAVAAVFGNTGCRRRRRCSAPTVLGFAVCRRRRTFKSGDMLSCLHHGQSLRRPLCICIHLLISSRLLIYFSGSSIPVSDRQ